MLLRGLIPKSVGIIQASLLGQEQGLHLFELIRIPGIMRKVDLIGLGFNPGAVRHRYDVMLLINGIPVVQIELKTLEVSPRRAMQQIVDYKNDPGNGYSNSLLCFMQLFIVSNHSNTYYFANNHNQHFSFNADEQLLPISQFAA